MGHPARQRQCVKARPEQGIFFATQKQGGVFATLGR